MDPETITLVYQAYVDGRMSPEEEKAYIADIQSGKMETPSGLKLKGETPVLDPNIWEAYTSGLMTTDEKIELEKDIAEGLWKAPEGAKIEETKPLSLLGKLEEQFTGSERTTPEVEALPDWYNLPELSQWPGLKTVLGTIATDIPETIQVIQEQHPEIQIRQDAKGNYILKSAMDDKEYAIKPGFRSSDAMRAAFTAAAFIPAGRAAKLSTQVIGAGLTQAGLEASQKLTGGKFDPVMIPLAGGAAGAGYLAGKGIAKAYQRFSKVAPVPVPPPEPVALGELTKTARKAAGGSTRAAKALAEQAAPDKEVIEAAQRLGIDEFLQPDHVSTSQSFRELAQAVKSVPGSKTRELELKGFEAIAKRADDLIDEIGGVQDLSQLDKTVKSRMMAIQSELDTKSEKLFSEVNAAIAPKTEAPATNLLKFLNDKADELGGVKYLDPLEKKLMKDLLPSSVPKGYKKLYPLGKDFQGRYSDEVFNAIELLDDVDLNDMSKLAEYTARAEATAQYIKVQNPAKRSDVLEAMAELDIAIPKALTPKKFIDPEMRDLTSKLRSAGMTSDEDAVSAFLNPSYMGKTDAVRLKKRLIAKGFDSTVESAPGGVLDYLPLTKNFVFKPKEPTYARIDNIRKKLTAARVRGQGEFKDADVGLIKKLEKELMKDQRAVAEAQGSLETFDLARKTVAVRKGVEDDMKSLFGKHLEGTIIGDLSEATKKLAAGDVSKFIQLIKAVPEDMRQEIVASGLNTAFGKTARNGQLNFNTFANWYEGLSKNKQAYTALMSNLPASARKQLKDLYKVSNGIRKASKERITTGRLAVVTDQFKEADNLMANIYSVAKRASVGIVAETAATSVGFPGIGLVAGLGSALTKGGKTNSMKAADALISSMEFMAMASQGTPSAAARLARTPAWKRFFKAVGEPRELTNPEQWILTAFQTQRQFEEKE